MHYKELLAVICFIAKFSNSEHCEKPKIINITVYKEIDSASEHLSIQTTKIETSEDIFHLVIANQTVPKICENYINIHNELSVLQIVNSSVTDIIPGAFNITPTLTLFRLTLNNIPNVKNNVFNNIKVKEIDLSKNHIITIEAEAFNNNSHLEILNLNQNLIKEINPDWFYNSPNVYKLSAIYNDIKILPANAFKNMAANRPLKLLLSANRIAEVDPEVLGDQVNVNLFRINGNRIKNIPENIFINRNLERLHIGLNLLKCFPDALFNSTIQNLEFLGNADFECECLKKVRRFVQENDISVLYPSIICEDRTRDVNIVFNFNSTVEIPLIPSTVDLDVYVQPKQQDTN